MFRAIGLIMLLWFLSNLFMQSFRSADDAISATFNALEAAAVMSEEAFKSQ